MDSVNSSMELKHQPYFVECFLCWYKIHVQSPKQRSQSALVFNVLR